MSNEITSLDEILYRGERPWLEHNSNDAKFASLHPELKLEVPDFLFKYEIQFERPFDHKTKYYYKYILNETRKHYQRIHTLISDDDNPKVIKYWLNDTLNKKLKTKLRDIGRLIKRKDFSLTYIDPRKLAHNDQSHRSNTFVIQLLKTSLIHLYLEIQDAFPDYIEDKLITEDFFVQLLDEPIPDKTYIKKVTTIEVINTTKKLAESKKKEPVFSFTYKQFNKSQTKLSDLFNGMKKNSLIAKDTSITNFKKVFSGNEIATPITWTGNASELYYFIKLLHNDYKLISNLNQQQWKVTCKCFVSSENGTFNPDKLKSLKKPKATAKHIETLASLLK
jgi:hypothetical protein